MSIPWHCNRLELNSNWRMHRRFSHYSTRGHVCTRHNHRSKPSCIWKGFEEPTRLKIASKTPRMIGVQASGAAPIATAYATGAEGVIFWKHPETSASAIRIGAPARWKGALAAVRESKGAMLVVTDGDIVCAQRLLADHEGIFAEPASAASVAGLIKSRKSRLVGADNQVVCIITAHGLKDQKAVVS